VPPKAISAHHHNRPHGIERRGANISLARLRVFLLQLARHSLDRPIAIEHSCHLAIGDGRPILTLPTRLMGPRRFIQAGKKLAPGFIYRAGVIDITGKLLFNVKRIGAVKHALEKWIWSFSVILL
jgi:hypothetical protein